MPRPRVPPRKRFTPRITHTAKALWLIYLLLTVLEIALSDGRRHAAFRCRLQFLRDHGGRRFFPPSPVDHGLPEPTITWIITLFMFLAGANFALQYKCFFKGKSRPLLTNDEFRFYLRSSSSPRCSSRYLLLRTARRHGLAPVFATAFFRSPRSSPPPALPRSISPSGRFRPRPCFLP